MQNHYKETQKTSETQNDYREIHNKHKEMHNDHRDTK